MIRPRFRKNDKNSLTDELTRLKWQNLFYYLLASLRMLFVSFDFSF